ncbi:hypothetical protein E4U55_005544 [Claviceps digitariae]|nr:hypothetical protein E4U55_005544 [Claviceps digitariae]
MKSNTILGSLALSALQVYHASAGFVDTRAPVNELLARTEYCCTQYVLDQTYSSFYLPYTGGEIDIWQQGPCKLYVVQNDVLPSQQYGCYEWEFMYTEDPQCNGVDYPFPGVASADVCRDPVKSTTKLPGMLVPKDR